MDDTNLKQMERAINETNGRRGIGAVVRNKEGELMRDNVLSLTGNFSLLVTY